MASNDEGVPVCKLQNEFALVLSEHFCYDYVYRLEMSKLENLESPKVYNMECMSLIKKLPSPKEPLTMLLVKIRWQSLHGSTVYVTQSLLEIDVVEGAMSRYFRVFWGNISLITSLKLEILLLVELSIHHKQDDSEQHVLFIQAICQKIGKTLA